MMYLQVLFLLLLPLLGTCEKASCRAARTCCDGKDASCMVPATSSNSNNIYDEYDDDYASTRDQREAVEPCYCDHGCLEVGDCCPDYKDYCGVIDCQVGEWSPWSPCSATCGSSGTSSRRRSVLRPESNGGRRCPLLKEERACNADQPCPARQSSRRHHHRMNRLGRVRDSEETAVLLPGKYARRYNPGDYDVRFNLKSFKPKDMEKENFQYCAVFRVDKATSSCHTSSPDTSSLHKGNTICVTCDSKAKRDSHMQCTGHGTEGMRTKFKDLMNPRCHGKWTRLTEVTEDCPCRSGKPDFVFV